MIFGEPGSDLDEIQPTSNSEFKNPSKKRTFARQQIFDSQNHRTIWAVRAL